MIHADGGRMKVARLYFMISVGLWAMNHLSWTQEAVGGTIAGTVVDKFGEPIKNAKVTTRNIDTEREKIYNTDKQGAYKLSELPAGTYWVTAEKDGYMQHRYTDVILGIGKTVELNFKLDPPGKIFVD
jgi:hypothetical protein